MSELKNNYIKAVEHFKMLVDDWNTCVDRNVSLPDFAWDKMLFEMEEAKRNADRAWKEYLNKELFAA